MLVTKEWLQDFLDKKLSDPEIVAALEAGGIEIESNRAHVLNVTTPANRPDLQSILGLAREIVANTNATLKIAPEAIEFTGAPASMFTNKIKQVVPRYTLSRFKLRQRVGPSPDWLRQRLESSGVRPINTVVDITNYIMLAYGQPLHAFDYAKIKGNLEVRYAKPGEELLTLDGVNRKLETSDVVISDDTGVIDLGGTMGGASSEISPDTKTVLIEAATFNSARVRKTALRLGLRTEASARFERGLPVELAPIGQTQALTLLDRLIGIDIETMEEHLEFIPTPAKIKLDTTRISQLAGIKITDEQINSSLNKRVFKIENIKNVDNGTSLVVKPPYWRTDIKEEADIFEEIIKFIGLDKIPATLPSWQPQELMPDNKWNKLWQIHLHLQGLSLFEVTTYPFISAKLIKQLNLSLTDHLKLKNPRSVEQAYLRTSLMPSMAEALRQNTRYSETIGLFEIARVFIPKPGLEQQPDEPLRLGVIIQAPKDVYGATKNVLDNLVSKYNVSPNYRVLNPLPYLHPKRQLEILLAQESAGYIGELHPQVLSSLKLRYPAAYLELDVNMLIKQSKLVQAAIPSRFQAMTRDITVAIDNQVNWQEIEHTISASIGIKPNYLGEYRGQKQTERALTLRLELVASNKNLTDEDAARVVDKVQKLLKKKFSANAQE